MTAILDALTPVGIFAIIFGSITAHRYMRHRETIKLIEHGYPPDTLRGGVYRPPVMPAAAWPPVAAQAPAPLAPLAPFAPFAPDPSPFAGAFAPPPAYPASQAPAVAPPYPSPTAPSLPQAYRGNRTQLVWGCILAGVGVALSLALWPIGFAVNAGGTVAFPLGIGPWMVAGFIPLFVGLALLLAYTITGGQPPRTAANAPSLSVPPPGSRNAREG